MKELDFDELDRAVNSLMSSVPKSTPAKPEDETANTLTISPTLSDGAAPDFKTLDNKTVAAAPKLDNSPEPQTVPAETGQSPVVETPHEPNSEIAVVPDQLPMRQTPPAARRGGRFMDVVHPSSDMKQPTRPMSREGKVLEPVATISDTLVQPNTKFDAIPTVEAPAKESTPEQPSSASEWPDPLEVAGFKHEQEAGKSEDEAPAATTTTPDTEADDNAEPLTSPFLSDAKVEKRPLGENSDPVAPPAEKLVIQPLAPPTDQSAASPEPQPQPASTAPDAPLPEELRGDLMAIESGSQTTPVQSSVEGSTAVESLPVSNEMPPASVPVAPVKHEDEAPTTPAPGSASIPQQYKEEPSTGDQTSGSIYDTDTYHTPLAHPAKKKSGWMWVIWIVVILLLGAGGGAAAYLMDFLR